MFQCKRLLLDIHFFSPSKLETFAEVNIADALAVRMVYYIWKTFANACSVFKFPVHMCFLFEKIHQVIMDLLLIVQH